MIHLNDAKNYVGLNEEAPCTGIWDDCKDILLGGKKKTKVQQCLYTNISLKKSWRWENICVYLSYMHENLQKDTWETVLVVVEEEKWG